MGTFPSKSVQVPIFDEEGQEKSGSRENAAMNRIVRKTREVRLHTALIQRKFGGSASWVQSSPSWVQSSPSKLKRSPSRFHHCEYYQIVTGKSHHLQQVVERGYRAPDELALSEI